MFSFFWRVMQKLWYNHEKKRRRQEIEMATWNSRGLRGSTLEEFINRTNEKYLENGLALIQKVPTPITPINIDKATRHITLAYFDQKSTVDYIGAVQGIPVCFDAKECNTDTFPLQNIHEHQVVFMENFGTGQKRVAEKASAMKNWSLIFFSGRAEASLFHIWMRCKKIWQWGIDKQIFFSYNKSNSFICYHISTLKCIKWNNWQNHPHGMSIRERY